jgi:hypothetical protein
MPAPSSTLSVDQFRRLARIPDGGELPDHEGRCLGWEGESKPPY